MTTPVFRIEADGQDATNAIRKSLVSLRTQDINGHRSDQLNLVLADPGNKIEIPRAGAGLELWLGYEGQELIPIGNYTVDGATPSAAPGQLSIRATAADMYSSLKAHRQRAWENVTIGDIVTTIASEHGLTPVIGTEFANIVIEREDQLDESDMHFLTRLSLSYDADTKPVAKRLVFVKRGTAKSATGVDLKAIELKQGDWINVSAPVEQRGRYNSVVAFYHDEALATRVEVRVGEGQPQFTILGNQTNAATAQAAAQAKFDELARGVVELDVLLKGRPDIFAEAPLTLSGFHKDIDGDFTITSVSHSLSQNGFTTSLRASNKA